MNIEYLREFIEVGLSLNLSKAAKTLHVSQPSLSKHIAALEQECQATLIKRSPSRIQLTVAGEALFEEAFRLVGQHDQALDRIRALKNVRSLKIDGLYESAAVLSLINEALAIVNREDAKLSISYQNHRHKTLAEMVQDGRIDMAITILSDDDRIADNEESLLLIRDPMVCLVGDRHPFASRKAVSIHELDGQTVLQPVGSHSAEHGRTTVESIFRRYGVRPIEQPVFVHSISELTTVAEREGIFIMERTMLDTQPGANRLNVVPIEEEDVAFSLCAIWRTTAPNPDAISFAQALAAAVKKQAGAR